MNKGLSKNKINNNKIILNKIKWGTLQDVVQIHPEF